MEKRSPSNIKKESDAETAGGWNISKRYIKRVVIETERKAATVKPKPEWCTKNNTAKLASLCYLGFTKKMLDTYTN